MVSYADFVTLLLAFFVALYGFTRLDSQKLAEAQSSIRQALHITFPGNDSPIIPELASGRLSPGLLPQTPPQGETEAQKQTRLEAQLAPTYRQLQQMLATTTAAGDVQLFFTPDGLVMRFKDLILFDTGKADVRPEVQPLLDQLVTILSQIPNEIVVEGHTDSRPIHTPQYPSNWELSTSRATAIARYFIGTGHLLPERLVVAGYGEYRPVADNLSESGQAANRRVDLIIRPAQESRWRSPWPPRA